MTRWFTSDLHFGHANIVDFSGRPFADVEEMNEAIIDRWNAVVGHHDEVWVLGDVALGGWRETLPANLARLHGHKTLVPGNHDRCWHGAKNGQEHRRAFYEAGFDRIIDAQLPRLPRTRVGGWMVNLCHFPYRDADQTDLRHVEHRPEDQGLWLVHGHVHEKWRQNGRQVNVGVDAWDYAPVNEDTIAEIIRHGERRLERIPVTGPCAATALA